MQNIVGLQDRLVKAAAAVGRGALPVLASGLQSLESSVEAVARMSRYDLVIYGASGLQDNTLLSTSTGRLSSIICHGLWLVEARGSFSPFLIELARLLWRTSPP